MSAHPGRREIVCDFRWVQTRPAGSTVRVDFAGGRRYGLGVLGRPTHDRESSGTSAPLLSLGARQMIVGALFFSVMSVCVKLASRHLPSSHPVMARGVVTFVLSFAALRRARISPWGVDKKRLVLRGLAGFVGLNCFYYSLKHLPLADATVIQNMNPIFTALLAAVLLKESMRPREIVCVLVSFVGVLLVAQPPFVFEARPVGDVLALAAALAGSVASAIAYVTIRRLRRTDDPLVIVFYFPLIAVPLSVGPVLRDATMPSAYEWALLAGIGVSTQIAQVFMTKGLHNETAGRATAVSYLQVAFAYGWGMLVFGELPNALGVTGTALVALGVLTLALGGRANPGGPADGAVPLDPAAPISPTAR